MTPRPLLTVSEVSRRSGFAPSALRFYEDKGLIEASRTPGQQRRYERVVLRRLAFIRAASNVGLTLDEIAEELRTLPRGRTPTAEDWRHISQDWRARLDERIAAIEALRDRLDGCIGCGCLSLGSCSLYNPEDVLGVSAQGARRLPELLRRPVAREREKAEPPRGVPEGVGAAG
jgi:MerR family transcriptional regulator, redox-sensitive transcriptional activator SoxR